MTDPQASVPTLAITAGDPAGIGPEITIKALKNIADCTAGLKIRIFGDRKTFKFGPDATDADVFHRWPVLMRADWRDCDAPVAFVDFAHQKSFTPGHSDANCGAASLAYLQEAVEGYRSGHLQAWVTAPVTKNSIQQVDSRFVGHTEFFANALGIPRVVMLFIADDMRVAILTRHLAINDVSKAITPDLLDDTIRMIAAGLKQHFRIETPKIAVCGLNPHAGENGAFGREEIEVFDPVLKKLRQEGIQCDGPLPADGYFAGSMRHDAVLCAYHDQGLVPFKMHARDNGCQMTLGLPLIRTSPDHGSALDIAGKGIADSGAMEYALMTAIRLLQR